MASELSLIPLSNEEIADFFSELDADNDGVITFDELEAKLIAVHQELAPTPQKHHLHHHLRNSDKGNNGQPNEKDGAAKNELHDFLYTLLPKGRHSLTRDEFFERVHSWQIPSQSQTTPEDQDADAHAYEHRLSFRRRLRARWSVSGPKAVFIACVVALQLAFGLWQLVIYIRNAPVRAALGWGVIMAKCCAGALYPTLFFMILSMSRHFATFIRRFYLLSRFINVDLNQAFHIIMACVALALATLHAIGHLTGTFLYSSRPAQQDNLAGILGPEAVRRSYRDFVSSLPGWSGITALGLFWIIALLSVPCVRRRSYEIFQLGHLLMFPMIGLLCAHGTAALLQSPMLGYWLAFPTLLVIIERLWRLYRSFASIPARLAILDDSAVSITCEHPRGKDWRYHAGQYVLVQVPAISRWQWHPFTISACVGDRLQVHVKTDGDWTSALRELAQEHEGSEEGAPASSTDAEGIKIRVGLDGPFGAPAQRFYDFDRSIIVGAGIGVTPFSAILTDIEQRFNGDGDPWALSRRKSISRSLSRLNSRMASRSASRAQSFMNGDVSPPRPHETATREKTSVMNDNDEPSPHDTHTHPPRRVDFHWMVRERNDLLWFSDLLNRAASLASPLCLQLSIFPHITMRRKSLSTHIFRCLLDRYRPSSAPYSALTGLVARSHFGRPDLEMILDTFHADMVRQAWTGGKVGVFFCGHPAIGGVLADRCRELTARARVDGSGIRYLFMMEVFN